MAGSQLPQGETVTDSEQVGCQVVQGRGARQSGLWAVQGGWEHLPRVGHHGHKFTSEPLVKMSLQAVVLMPPVTSGQWCSCPLPLLAVAWTPLMSFLGDGAVSLLLGLGCESKLHLSPRHCTSW